MKKVILVSLALGSVLAGTMGQRSVKATSLSCSQIEAFGNALRPQILSQLNSQVAGISYEINPRKTLRINQINQIGFSGCQMTTDTNITLKRKIRRDAHGTVAATGIINYANLAEKKICFKEAKVTDVNLSRTSFLGESLYKWVANKVIPNQKCLNL
ncbi:MAG: hypothetical protein MH252_16950 [Thermosynechococcaceae cyanobacterium MS004]|nr:hypothetical protein [Thermosynechococcaceae cyanobacterium MS004]